MGSTGAEIWPTNEDPQHSEGPPQKDTSGAVRAYGKVSKEFLIGNGVRQGDVLAPTLFNLFFDAVVSMALERHQGNGLTILFNTSAELVGDRKQMREQFLIPDLEYADDMCLLSNSMDELEEMLLDLDQSCNQMGLSISARKTKILSITSNQQEFPRRVTLQSADEPVDVIEEFEYLGSVVTSSCELDREISTRIRKASDGFRSLCRTL